MGQRLARGCLQRREDHVRDIFLVASAGTDLRVFAKTTNEDEF
jgi:hypothetical protein